MRGSPQRYLLPGRSQDRQGFWTALSESNQCHVVSDDFASRLNVWCCVSQVLRQSTATLTSYVCAFLSNMRHKWHSGSAILVVFFTVLDVKHRNFSRAMKLFVEPHQLSECLSTQHVNIILRCSCSRVRSCHHPMIQDVALHISLLVVALPTLS